MNTNKIKLSLGLLCGLLFIPTSADAASNAVWLTDTTALFTIDFGFEHEEFTTGVPVVAVDGVSYSDRVDHLGYTLKSSQEETPKITNLNSIVLGSATIEDGKYFVPANEKAVFRLVILATFDEPLAEATVQARITKLPYWLDGRRTTVHQNQLDELGAPVLELK